MRHERGRWAVGVRAVGVGVALSALLACSSGGDDGAAGAAASSGAGAVGGGGGTSAGAGGSGTGGGSGGDTASGGASGNAGSGGTGGSGGSGGNAALGACGNAEGQLFPPAAPWNTRVDDAALASDSHAVIDYLQANHDTAARFQVDFSLTVLHADASTPRERFMPTGDFYEPDCDATPLPIVEGGAIEGESGYACESDGDCHLLVVQEDACRLYEMWRADQNGSGFDGGCLALWEIDRVYPETLRGDYCTSADAAGLPITPLLFTADEIAAGEIKHALRFILPNEHIRALLYVRPGTHATRATSGPVDAPPYAARLRLRTDADLSALNPAARVVAVALQRYGMILADGGNLTFTAQSDRFGEHSWDEVGFGPHDLKALPWSAFEVVEGGEPIDWESGSCERTPIVE